MMRKNELAKWNKLDSLVKNSKSLKINVFTSSSCAFCNDALDAAKQAAAKFHQFDFPIEVVETSVEDQPEITEALNVVALPMILIGNSKIIGTPCPEDIEQILHNTMLSG
ncbi:MAG: thioredoxin family protein [Promethearchaeota archaeon]